VDSAELVADACSELHPPGARLVSPPLDNLADALEGMRLGAPSDGDLLAWRTRLATALAQVETIETRTQEFADSRAFPRSDVPLVAANLVRQVRRIAAEYEELVPWVAVLAEP